MESTFHVVMIHMTTHNPVIIIWSLIRSIRVKAPYFLWMTRSFIIVFFLFFKSVFSWFSLPSDVPPVFHFISELGINFLYGDDDNISDLLALLFRFIVPDVLETERLFLASSFYT
jgi:hypothetical protein